MKANGTYDVVIAGGGPAALSAAILLGRLMREVLVCDAGGGETEGFLDSRHRRLEDSCCPAEWLRTGRIQMNRLNSVSSVRRSVSDAQRDHGGFLVSLEGGRTCRAKALLLASDFTARPPDLADVKRFYGSSLHQCPYCGGWEHRGRRIGVIGRDDAAAAMAVKLLSWTQRVTLYTHGTHLPQSAASKVAGLPVDVVTGTVRSLEGRGRHLESIRMENGFCYPCQALFFPSQVESHLHLANRVGGEFTDVAPFHDLASHQPGIQGLFRIRGAGDGIEMAVCSAAEGVRAAESVNQWLTQADHSYLAVRQSA